MSFRSFSSWLNETAEVQVRAFMQGDGTVHLDPDCPAAGDILIRAGSVKVPAQSVCLNCVMVKIQEDSYWPPVEIVHAPRENVAHI